MVVVPPYSRRPVQPSLDAIKAGRESTASILEALSETEWERAGVHNEMGDYSIDRWLEVYAAHCHDHADQARRAAGDGGEGHRLGRGGPARLRTAPVYTKLNRYGARGRRHALDV